jgi:hypothetical protein
MVRSLVIIVCVAGVAASPVMAADKWAKASVLLKHATPPIRAGKTGSIPSLFQVGWPANVVRTEGTWALLSGEPGFQKNAEIGWIRVYDLVNGSDDPTSSKDSQHYTSRINESHDNLTRATWYWLRGIYWDTNNDTRAAITDYALAIYDLDNPTFFSACKELANLKQQSIEASAAPPEEPAIALSDNDRNALLSDCYRRLGTALATDDAVCNYDCWKECFAHAERFLPVDDSGHQPTAPRLYYEWGNAYESALSSLFNPGASPQACPLPSDLNDKNKPTMVPTVFQRARDRLNSAVLRDSRWADPHVALGDLNSTYAYYLAAAKSAKAKDGSKDKKTTTAPPDPVEVTWRSAVDEYREATQRDSGSNKGYLGRSKSLQQLAYFLANAAAANTVTCDESKPAGCSTAKPSAKTESTAGRSAASGQTQASTGKTATTNPASQKPPKSCPCCVTATKPDPATCDPLTGLPCDPGDPPPEAAICQLALLNSQCNPKPSSDVTKAFATVSTLLAAAADSAQSALSIKDLSDKSSVKQLATTLRDLALLNDASPSVAFQYAASAFNLASNGVVFAAKIEDGDSLRSFADKMETLYESYLCQANPDDESCKQNPPQPSQPASPAKEGQPVTHFQAPLPVHAETKRNVPVRFYQEPLQFNYSKMPLRLRR